MRWLDADERSAKAAIFGLNSVGRRPNELEEAWIVQALVREDGLTQVEAADVAGPAQELGVSAAGAAGAPGGESVQAELRLGLLSPGLARQLTRLPVGNQAAVLTAARRQSLTMAEVQGSSTCCAERRRSRKQYLLERPARGLAASGRRVHAGARSASESGREPAGPATGYAARSAEPPGELATSSRTGRVETRGSPAAGPAFVRLARDGPRLRRPGGRPVARRTAG